MKRIATISAAITLSACGNLHAGTTPGNQPQIDHVAFRACVDGEAHELFAVAMKTNPIAALYGYHTDIYNEIISKCAPHMGNEGLIDTISPSNSDFAYVNAAVEAEAKAALTLKENEEGAQMKKQQEVDAGNEKIEKQEEDKAVSNYYGCLEQKAKTLALVSAETADIVAQATLSSCPTERMALVGVIDRYIPTGGNEVVARLEASFTKSLLLEIIKARATPEQKPAAPKAGRAPI